MIVAGIPIKVKEDIINNFDVSVVMPFYKKLNEFKAVFPLVDDKKLIFVSYMIDF